MEVLYLSWGEVVVTSGIFKNLISEQIHNTEVVYKKKIYVCSAVPLINRTWLFNKKKWNANVAETKAIFQKNNFLLISLPIPSSFFYSKWFEFPLVHFFGFITLLNYIKKNNIGLIHCRSYHSAFISLKIKRILKKQKIHIIFDTRGTVPEEGIIAGKYKYNGLSYMFWKKIEKYCMDNCDQIVNVSEEFTNYVRTLTRNKQLATIYASVNTDYFNISNNKNNLRLKWGLEHNLPIMVYSGALVANGYHSYELIARLYKYFKQRIAGLTLLVLSRSDQTAIKMMFANEGIVENELILREGKSPIEVAEILQCCNFAIFPFKHVDSYSEEIMAKTMIGSKIPEYLAAGLPIVCNSDVSCVSELLIKNNVGVTFCSDKIDKCKVDSLKALINDNTIAIKCYNVGNSLFSVKTAACQYAALYKKFDNI